MICLDLKDFSPQATKYQRFRILRNLSYYINYFNFFQKKSIRYQSFF